MKVTVLAVGSQGDVQPYVALGGGLARAGFSVRLASHGNFRDIARRAGLDFALIAGNPVDIVNGPKGMAWLSSTNSYVKFLSRARALARNLIGDMSRDALKAAEGSDALVFSLPLSIPGFSVADSLRIPAIPAALYPLHPTPAFPSIMTPDLALGAAGNWLSGVAVEQLYWQLLRSLNRSWRRELGIPPLPFLSPVRRLERAGIPFLYGYSPSVIPTPPGWPPQRTVCGYWFLEDQQDWKPARQLSDFLAAGPAPIYIGFGSMTSADSTLMTQNILEAVRRTGQRAILSTGWGGFQTKDLPETILPVGFVSHSWLFPRVSLAIHHGGAGTTAAILRAGVPSIVVPFFADQFFWGRRVRELRVGAGPIPRRLLTADRMESAIRKILEDRDITERSRRLGNAIRGEDGISVAVSAVQDYLRSTTPRRRV